MDCSDCPLLYDFPTLLLLLNKYLVERANAVWRAEKGFRRIPIVCAIDM